MKKLLTLSLLALSVPFHAFAKIPVKWDCLLRSDTVNCTDIQNAFFAANDGFEQTTGPASLSINLRSNALNDKIEYKYIITGAKIQSEVSYELNNHLSVSEKEEKLITELNKLVDGYKAVLQYQTSGTTSIDESPFYLTPSLSASGKKQPGNASGEASLGAIANYSTKDWRLLGYQFTDLAMEKDDATAFTSAVNVKVYYFDEGFGIVRSLTDHWDLAIRGERIDVQTNIVDRDLHLPASVLNNHASLSIIRVGGEWTLHPFISDKTNGNVTVRYHLAAEHNDYIDPQSFQHKTEDFALHTMELVVSHHFQKLDLTGSATAYASSLREKQLVGGTLTGDVSYRLSSRLSLGTTVGVTYNKNPVPSAAAGRLSFIQLTSGDYQKDSFSYSGKLTLRFTLGNARLYNNEQRWKYTN